MQSIRDVNARHDQGLSNEVFAKLAGYGRVEDKIYGLDNPLVQDWIKFFHDRSESRQTFQEFAARTEGNSHQKAIVVATQWYEFSRIVPQLLCVASAKVSTNEMRHYVIQTAFEELGMRKVNDIHAEMFKTTAHNIGINQQEFTAVGCLPAVADSSMKLEATLHNFSSDAVVMGMLLGLEVPAIENIETVFACMAYDSKVEAILHQDRFFRIHRGVETEHIRLTVANFLRFCPDHHSKLEFLAGVDSGLDFWANFWGAICDQIIHLRDEALETSCLA